MVLRQLNLDGEGAPWTDAMFGIALEHADQVVEDFSWESGQKS